MRGIAVTILLALALLAGLTAAQERVYRLAVLSPNPATMEAMRTIILVQLAKQGFVDGRNLRVDTRFGEIEVLPVLAKELVAAAPDVIFASSNLSVEAALAATKSVPIVMFGQDPGGSGYAQSLARPGGQVTGVAILTADLDVKRLELLRDLVPGARRAAVLIHHTARDNALRDETLNQVAARHGLVLSFHYIGHAQDYASAFGAMREMGAEFLIVSANTNFARDVTTIASLARELQLPTVCEWQEMAAQGCLLGYGPSRSELYRLSANYIARILKGAVPGELPIEQPANFELGVNMQVAHAVGVTIPPTLLLRADEVTE
jgi:putative tryptophan/tyrosine transport system substrate-binding protein